MNILGPKNIAKKILSYIDPFDNLTHLQSKQTRKIADDDGAQWFEDAKKLPEIDSLQFV